MIYSQTMTQSAPASAWAMLDRATRPRSRRGRSTRKSPVRELRGRIVDGRVVSADTASPPRAPSRYVPDTGSPTRKRRRGESWDTWRGRLERDNARIAALDVFPGPLTSNPALAEQRASEYRALRGR